MMWAHPDGRFYSQWDGKVVQAPSAIAPPPPWIPWIPGTKAWMRQLPTWLKRPVFWCIRAWWGRAYGH